MENLRQSRELSLYNRCRSRRCMILKRRVGWSFNLSSVDGNKMYEIAEVIQLQP